MENQRGNNAIRNVVGCCMGIFWAGAIGFGYPGIMSTYWQEQFNVTSTETGFVVTVMLVAISVCTFFSGKFLNRFGMRSCIVLGTALIVCAMILLMVATNIYMVYIWAFMINLGASFVYGPGLTTAQKSLPHRKGLASGLMNLSFGISAAIMSPIWEKMLNSFGNRAVEISLIVCVIVTNIIAFILVKEDGTGAAVGSDMASGKETSTATVEMTALQAVKTKSFWIMWITWAFVGAAGISMVSLSKSYAAYLGLSSVAVLMAFNLTNGIGRLIAGWLCDIIGSELTAIIGFLIATAGYALLPHVSGGVPVCVLAACIGYGFGSLFSTTGPTAIRRFGLKYFGLIFGLILTAYGCVGGIIGPLLAGVILEKAASPYNIIFAYLAAFMFLGAVFMFLLVRVNKEKFIIPAHKKAGRNNK